jgi:hypothetical protein
VLEELITRFVDCWCCGVAFQIAGSGEFAGEVVACIEEFKEAAYCVEIFVDEIDATFLIAPYSALSSLKMWWRNRFY